jgi:hypothetical protein
MIQEQLSDYISSQFKLGVSRDTIKTTLTGAGWIPADVEDTLKKVESTASPSIVATNLAAPAGAVTNPQPQTIKVSDLVSSGAASTPTMPATKSTSPKSPLTGPSSISAVASSTKNSADNTFPPRTSSAATPHGSKTMLIVAIVLAVIALGAGGFAAFLYMQNGSLNTQLSSLNGQSTGVDSKLSALQTQMAASTTALTAQVATLGAAAQELKTELSFYAAPSGTTPGVGVAATFSGTVSGGGKSPYIITAMYGAKIFVSNSKSANVIAALAPLTGSAGTPVAASSTTATSTASTTPATPVAVSATAPISAQFSGTYIPGADTITIAAVNGTAL